MIDRVGRTQNTFFSIQIEERSLLQVDSIYTENVFFNCELSQLETI